MRDELRLAACVPVELPFRHPGEYGGQFRRHLAEGGLGPRLPCLPRVRLPELFKAVRERCCIRFYVFLTTALLGRATCGTRWGHIWHAGRAIFGACHFWHQCQFWHAFGRFVHRQRQLPESELLGLQDADAHPLEVEVGNLQVSVGSEHRHPALHGAHGVPGLAADHLVGDRGAAEHQTIRLGLPVQAPHVEPHGHAHGLSVFGSHDAVV